ncbi:MAG: cytochrome c biogenesis protein CcsA [Gemmatimonadota bacterium]|nr:MAG: cytochrome c biogenesis protein CcsA [Gemmatimonadota bacterium]
MARNRLRHTGVALAVLGVLGTILVEWMVFFWVPTERTMGIAQRIFYVHVPSAWIAFLAFGIVALCSAVYLWLKDDRLDMAALAAAEGGIAFCTIMILTGPLWARVSWGTWWQWEPRLVLTLLMWFIYLGYFMVRRVTENPEQGKRFAAVVGLIGVLDIPLIHVSVLWTRSLHPQPVVVKPEGPTLDPEMLITLMAGLAAALVLFTGLFLIRYTVECLHREVAQRRLGV